jgi:hypothetical protein
MEGGEAWVELASAEAATAWLQDVQSRWPRVPWARPLAHCDDGGGFGFAVAPESGGRRVRVCHGAGGLRLRLVARGDAAAAARPPRPRRGAVTVHPCLDAVTARELLVLAPDLRLRGPEDAQRRAMRRAVAEAAADAWGDGAAPSVAVATGDPFGSAPDAPFDERGAPCVRLVAWDASVAALARELGPSAASHTADGGSVTVRLAAWDAVFVTA